MALFYCIFASSAVMAQGDVFGKNKVHYTRLDWYYIQSDHFDVYFSEGMNHLAEFTAAVAESGYKSMSILFDYELDKRISIVVYKSHNEFQQTNIVSEYMEEGIGGVTELFKNRVVIPFEGDYGKFHHVIRHELVHAVINEMFYGGSIQSIIVGKVTLVLPLWFNEGLAEYLALQWDIDSDMFLRDAAIHEYLPEVEQLDGYFAYRGGQSLWWYIAQTYGVPKVGEIVSKVRAARSLDNGFKGALGFGVKELSKRWRKSQKTRYWPDVAKKEEPDDYARRVTDHRKDGSFFNINPAISPNGQKLAFISDREDQFQVFLMDLPSGRIEDYLTDDGQTVNFEELHLLQPGISWSPDGKKVCIATKAGAEDAVIIIDIETKEKEKILFGLDGVFSVKWSPKGDKIAFVGTKIDRSDIYAYTFSTRELVNLTADISSDADPAWAPDGKTIYFSSDRSSAESPGIRSFYEKDIYSINLATREVERVLEWSGSEESSVVVAPGGKRLFFISDRNGINNIYEFDLEKKESRPITNSLSGIYYLSLSWDGEKLLFSSMSQGGFDIFMIANPLSRKINSAELEKTDFSKRHSQLVSDFGSLKPVPRRTTSQSDTSGVLNTDPDIDLRSYVFTRGKNSDSLYRSEETRPNKELTDNKDESGKYKVRKYKIGFSPDIVYGSPGYSTFYGVYGLTYISLSDMLGDHQISFATNLQLDLKNSDYGVSYSYLGDRLNLGFSGFHSARFLSLFDAYGGSSYRFRAWGLSGTASYPLDRFRRADMSLAWYNASRENISVVDNLSEYRYAVVPSLSYVYDTALWGFTGPVSGSRYRLNLFISPPLGGRSLSFTNVTFDYRTYFRLTRYYSFAIRFTGGGSFGKNPQKFIIGGVENWLNRSFEGGNFPFDRAEDFLFLEVGTPLRGYNYNAARGSRYALFNFEFRYPFLAFAQVGPLPFGFKAFGASTFFDTGLAWNKESELVLFTHGENSNFQTKDLLMGMGTGAQLYFLNFLVRFDVAWSWNIDSFSPPKYYISLGSDF